MNGPQDTSGVQNEVEDQNATKSAAHELMLNDKHPDLKCKNKYSAEQNKFAISNTASKIPPFEYYVMSEHGLHLFVDLNSSVPEWINSLKNNLCLVRNESNVLFSLEKNSNDMGNQRTTSTRNTFISIQNIGSERNDDCVSSSLCTSMGDFCHHNDYLLDATISISGSAANRNMGETSALVEGNQLLSSSCTTYSDTLYQNSFDSTCPRTGKLLSEELVKVKPSLCLEKSSAPVPGVSFNCKKNWDTFKCQTMDIMKCQNIAVSGSDPDHIVSGAVDDNLTGPCKEACSPVSDGIQQCQNAACVSLAEDKSDVVHQSTEGECADRLSEASGSNIGLLATCENNEKGSSVCLLTAERSDVDYVELQVNNHLADIHTSSVSEGLVLQLEDEPGQGDPVKKKETSGHLNLKIDVDHSFKRRHEQSFREESKNRRLHSASGNKNGTTMHLRSTSNLHRESSPGPAIPPRRSSRLTHKHDPWKNIH